MQHKTALSALIFCTLTLSSAAWAACSSPARTIFQCVTTNNKIVQVCDTGKKIHYTFGKVKAVKPELSFSVPRERASTYQWSGFGRAMNYHVTIPNGDTEYLVYHSLDKHTTLPEAGIAVIQQDITQATLACNLDKKFIFNIEGIDLPRE